MAKTKKEAAPKADKKTTPKKEAAPKVVRVNQNGVTRPKEGTKTGTVWAIADTISATNERPAYRKEVLEEADKAGINPATATTQYGQWRRFHGLKGRGRPPEEEGAKKPAKPAKPAAKKAAKKAAKGTKKPDPTPVSESAPTAAEIAAADQEWDDENSE